MNGLKRGMIVMGSLLLGTGLLGVALGQAPGVRVVSDHDFTPDTLPADVKVVQDVIELAPNICSGYHEHGGPGIETVITGAITVQNRGETAIQTYKAGEAYVYQAGVIHQVCNPTSSPATFTSAFLLLNGADALTPR